MSPILFAEVKPELQRVKTRCVGVRCLKTKKEDYDMDHHTQWYQADETCADHESYSIVQEKTTKNLQASSSTKHGVSKEIAADNKTAPKSKDDDIFDVNLTKNVLKTMVMEIYGYLYQKNSGNAEILTITHSPKFKA